MSGVVLAHLAATWFMTGLIWFVHVVHYRLFAAVGRAGFAAYEERHTRLTGYIVMPVMLVEIASAGILLLRPEPELPAPFREIGFGLLILIWIITGLVAVPAHARLARGFEAVAHRRLMNGNAARTALWTARACVASLPLLS